MSNDTNMIKLFDERFIYDASMGNTYFAGDEMIEALKQVLDLSWESKTRVDAKFVESAKQIIRNKMKRGHFSGQPFSGYKLPSKEELFSPKLKQLTLVVTEQCCLRCNYCPYSCNINTSYRKHGLNNMSKEIADSAIKYFIRNAENGSGIGFYGGEPLLNFDLIKYVVNKVKKDAKGLDVNFSITTNLNVFSPEIASFLVNNNFITVISIDGPQDIHDRYRKRIDGSESFSTLIQNLNFIRDNYLEYYTSNILSNTVLSPPLELDKVDDFFSNFNPPLAYSRFSLASESNPEFYTSLDRNHKEEADNISKWTLNKLFKLIEHGQINNEDILLKGLLEQYIKGLQNPCGTEDNMLLPFKSCIPGEKMSVNIDGSLSICEKCDTIKIGHIDTGIEFEKTTQLVYDWINILDKNCLNCWAARFCKVCYIAAWNESSLDSPKLQSYCSSMRKNIAKWLEIYLPIKKYNKNFFDFLNEIDNKFT